MSTWTGKCDIKTSGTWVSMWEYLILWVYQSITYKGSMADNAHPSAHTSIDLDSDSRKARIIHIWYTPAPMPEDPHLTGL